MSWTSNAEVLADATDLGVIAARMAGRCRATGLDWRSFRGVVRAAASLGVMPYPADASTAWPTDTAVIEELLDLVDLVRARRQRVRELISSAHVRAAVLRRHLGDLAYDQRAIRMELRDIATALEVLDPVPARLSAASSGLAAAPEQMGSTYAAVYRLLAGGHRMPARGRWLTGEATT